MPPRYETSGRQLERRVRDGEIVDVDVVRQTADGRRPFNLRSVPLDSAAGSVEGYAIYTDLTSSEPTDRSVLQDSPAEPISGRPVAEEHRGQHRRESMVDHQNEDRDEPDT